MSPCCFISASVFITLWSAVMSFACIERDVGHKWTSGEGVHLAVVESLVSRYLTSFCVCGDGAISRRHEHTTWPQFILCVTGTQLVPVSEFYLSREISESVWMAMASLSHVIVHVGGCWRLHRSAVWMRLFKPTTWNGLRSEDFHTEYSVCVMLKCSNGISLLLC